MTSFTFRTSYLILPYSQRLKIDTFGDSLLMGNIWPSQPTGVISWGLFLLDLGKEFGRLGHHQMMILCLVDRTQPLLDSGSPCMLWAPSS